MADYDLRTVEIDQDHLGVPDTVYSATFIMSSTYFASIVKDLAQISNCIEIKVQRDKVTFSSADVVREGGTGGTIILNQVTEADFTDEKVIEDRAVSTEDGNDRSAGGQTVEMEVDSESGTDAESTLDSGNESSSSEYREGEGDRTKMACLLRTTALSKGHTQLYSALTGGYATQPAC